MPLKVTVAEARRLERNVHGAPKRSTRIPQLAEPATVTITITPLEWQQTQRRFAPSVFDKLRAAIEAAERARAVLRGKEADREQG